MTEQEAATKWCPFSRVLGDDLGNEGNGAASYNRVFVWGDRERVAKISSGSFCIGSACMAWRDGPANHVGGHCGLVK